MTALEHGRHVPASHPVLKQLPRLPDEDLSITDDLECIGRRVAHMQRWPLTVAQRHMARMIAEELLRRTEA